MQLSGVGISSPQIMFRESAMDQKDVIIRADREESPVLWIILAIALPTVIPGVLALLFQI